MGTNGDKQGGRGRGDHAGYYRTLGLEPGASAAQIKAAYRSLAMELHPDRNPGRDTKARFQALGHAYAVLSAEKKRQQYDADSVVREAQGAAADSMAGAAPLYAPVCCSRCKAISAQPRYKVFYSVYGWLWGANRKASQGVFCGHCEFWVGLRATATSLMTGWWSLTGPLQTCQAVYANFRGGYFEHQNARLMGYQSMYFAHTGKIDLALAVAAQATDLVRSAPANSPDNLMGLAQSLKDLTDAYAGRAHRASLKAYRIWSDRRIVAQALITAFFAASVVSGIGLVLPRHDQNPLAENANSRTSDRSAPRPLTFQAPGFNLPPSGVFRAADANPSVANSSFLIEPSANQASTSQGPANIALKLVNPAGSHKWLKLLRASDESEIVGLFIRSGDTVEVTVPVGAYRVKAATGQTWQGENARFGPKTQYFAWNALLQLGADHERSKTIIVDFSQPNGPSKPVDRLLNELDPSSF